ncbi:hypothetical protein BCR32DRAFT_249965 [Anaeromyces robustus]|uniref:CCHC-type domain-containing protein n=1 Tax=Anaeromyces robustus TaxID=1754192 RepID=A0A1Y1WJM7_9FUNG|nr:hypothetical protein BCR32DRAFT_249965 [Anaeromyces robustus]|eukprot:ORX73426.1 hypothetical protein BCR32DRAFT_249965 [Anaeromyces robustus]
MGESVDEFNTKFDTLLNKINLKLSDEVIISYYINAFRNFIKTYETLLESESRNLEEAKKITRIIHLQITLEIIPLQVILIEIIPLQTIQIEIILFQITHRNYYNYNNNLYSNNNNFQKSNNLSQGIEYRRNSLRNTQNSNDDLQEITKKLADLKINVCINCQRIGHIVEECPELEDSEHLN